jgi:hypothetical protein
MYSDVVRETFWSFLKQLPHHVVKLLQGEKGIVQRNLDYLPVLFRDSDWSHFFKHIDFHPRFNSASKKIQLSY